MNQNLVPYRRPPSSELHPRIYEIMVGLAAWLILSVWLFAINPNTDYLLVVVSGFVVIAVMIPVALWQTWRRRQRDPGWKGPSLRDWANGRFQTWQYETSAKNSAIEVLVPIMAVSFGMTAFGIVFLLVKHFG
jgi:hypothetical protein